MLYDTWIHVKKDLKKVLAVNPEYAPAYRSMGNNYFNLGRYDEALAAFKTAVRIDPDWIMWTHVLMCCISIGYTIYID